MEIQLGVIEAKYADMIWEHEPVTSSELVKMTAVEFNWKRTTAHNVLRRLIDKGLFQNENGVVTSVISREEFYSRQSRQYVDDTFTDSGGNCRICMGVRDDFVSGICCGKHRQTASSGKRRSLLPGKLLSL